MAKNCLIGGRYTMIADFYEQTTTRNEAGQIIRSWNRDSPHVVRNRTVGILGGGIRVVGSTELWGEDYEDVEWAKMYISSQFVDGDEGPVLINRRFRVSNIRDMRSEKELWIGDDGASIEFNVLGITPIMDPFGAAVEFELLLKGETGD